MMSEPTVVNLYLGSPNDQNQELTQTYTKEGLYQPRIIQSQPTGK